MNKTKRSFSSDFKAQVALDLIRESDTLAQICSKHEIHPTQAGQWRSLAIGGLASIFDNKPDVQLQEKEELIDALYRQVGKLQVELDWLKKKTRAG